MRIPSPSELRRVDACIGSELLPHSDLLSPRAERGAVIHAFLAACRDKGREAALLAVHADYRPACEVIDLSRLPPLDPAQCLTEAAYALNVDTGEARFLATGITREEARARCGPREMPMIADWVGLTEFEAVVIDWKTGWGHVDRAETNWQVCTYGLAIAKAHGRERAQVGIIRVLDNGIIWWDLATLDLLDLDAAEAQVRQVVARLEAAHRVFAETGALPKLVEGEHCRYCPALMRCPVKGTFVAALVPQGDHAPKAYEQYPVQLTPEMVAEVWPKLAIAEGILARIRQTAEAVARQHPVRLSNGMLLAEVEQQRETIVAEKALPILSEKFGPEFAEAVAETKVSVTKVSLREELRARVLPELPKSKQKITILERSVLAELEAGGALKVQTYRKVDVIKPERAPALPEGGNS